MATMTVNGNTIQMSENSNVNISANRIIVDGKEVFSLENTFQKEINISITSGTVNSITSEQSVTVRGNVEGNVKAGNSISCNDVNGDVKAGNSVSCEKVSGNVKAGGSISIG